MTLKMLLEAGYLREGDEVRFKEFKGEVMKDGTIFSKDVKGTHLTPSNWATTIARMKNPTANTSCNGWDLVSTAEGKPLSHYRNLYLAQQLQLPRSLKAEASSSSSDLLLPPEERDDFQGGKDLKRKGMAQADSPDSTDSETPLAERLSKSQKKSKTVSNLVEAETRPSPISRPLTPTSPSKKVKKEVQKRPKASQSSTASPAASSPSITVTTTPSSSKKTLETTLEVPHENDHITRLNVVLPKKFALDRDICSLCASFGQEHTKDGQDCKKKKKHEGNDPNPFFFFLSFPFIP